MQKLHPVLDGTSIVGIREVPVSVLQMSIVHLRRVHALVRREVRRDLIQHDHKHPEHERCEEDG